MTEAYEEDWLVRVRAQVMCRDATTGGWLAQGGGGLADVTVGKRPRARRHTRPPPSRHAPGVAIISVANESSSPGRPVTTQPIADTRHQPGVSPDAAVAEVTREQPCFEYFIHGTRICDQVVVLSCTIKKDFQYNKVMPTFHHWVTEEKRFGLTFQTAADARAFDRGVRTAVEELLDGRGGWSLPACRPAAPRDDDADNIFESMSFPESRPASDHSSDLRHQQRKEQVRTSELLLQASLVPEQRADAENYSYVQLHPIHEYTYPQLGALQNTDSTPRPTLKRMSSSSLKKRGCVAQGCPLPLPPPLPAKKPQSADPKITPIRCRHCHEWYLEHNNHAGSCEFAPDCCGTTINALSAIKCAQCMLYHCMSDAEGEFPVHPCACSPTEDGCATRWFMVSLLSVFVPCLCCYPPLALARAACRKCGAAGGRHAP